MLNKNRISKLALYIVVVLKDMFDKEGIPYPTRSLSWEEFSYSRQEDWGCSYLEDTTFQ